MMKGQIEGIEKKLFATTVLLERIEREKNPFSTIPDVRRLAVVQLEINRDLLDLLKKVVVHDGK